MAWASQLPPGYSIEIVRSSVTVDFIVTILRIRSLSLSGFLLQLPRKHTISCYAARTSPALGHLFGGGSGGMGVSSRAEQLYSAAQRRRLQLERRCRQMRGCVGAIGPHSAKAGKRRQRGAEGSEMTDLPSAWRLVGHGGWCDAGRPRVPGAAWEDMPGAWLGGLGHSRGEKRARRRNEVHPIVIFLVLVVALASLAAAQLSPTFYDRSCPRAMATIKSAVNVAVAQEARMGASLLRLHFHDCFGCDASVLLAGNEQNAGFNVIANIKAQVEAICKQTVSCADILAVAARDSVVAAHCSSYRAHIYSDTNINQAFAASLKASCPAGSGGATVLAPLDTTTPTRFDNAYFTNLLNQKGLLHSDQQLFNGGSTDSTVRNFASSPAVFSSAFATAMVKMGNIRPLTGTQGQIRTTCSAANSMTDERLRRDRRDWSHGPHYRYYKKLAWLGPWSETSRRGQEGAHGTNQTGKKRHDVLP
ncbi:hypothetical protein HU200_045661 [Digitaria exilis]|uniref:Plant heme peroxidase family profile domain-containing protein n=1 Tax=Digitaria exilis TaxID=1010633 RepID=A0A835B2C6_9POAL|nr:hypothetical protein HU200_045661 [Digitaria exilis]